MTNNKKALDSESCVPTNILSHSLYDNNIVYLNSGYIKLYRNLLNWEWYSNLPTRVFFIHCLLKANHTTKKWQGYTIKAGQFITSLNHLAKETGLTLRQIRTVINKLKMTQELTIETTRQNTIITVNNWDKWQSEQQSERQISDTPATTTKNDKNIDNKIDKKFNKPTIEDIEKYCKERNNSINAEKFHNYYEANGWIVGKTKMKDWKAAIRTWEQNQKNFNNQSSEHSEQGGAEYVWNPNL